MRCIYCLKDKDTGVSFQGVEHVIPQAFGTFSSNTPTVSCVCDGCNSYFGHELDQFLARETIEGVSRYARGVLSSESRAQRRLEITLADEEEVGPLAGVRVSIDGANGNLMLPRAQFHAFNFKTNQNEVYFLEQIPGLALPETTYGAPGKDGIKGTWRVRTFAASKEEHDELVAALQANGIEYGSGTPFQIPNLPTGEGGKPGTLLVEVQGEVDTRHRRALAKVLMNFIASTLGCDEALKSRWDFLRGYVRYAKGLIRWRSTERPFWSGQETQTLRFADDSIDVRVENLNGNIVGSIQFYARSTYQLILAEHDALSAEEEVAYRFTRGMEPIRGEKGPAL